MIPIRKSKIIWNVLDSALFLFSLHGRISSDYMVWRLHWYLMSWWFNSAYVYYVKCSQQIESFWSKYTRDISFTILKYWRFVGDSYQAFALYSIVECAHVRTRTWLYWNELNCKTREYECSLNIKHISSHWMKTQFAYMAWILTGILLCDMSKSWSKMCSKTCEFHIFIHVYTCIVWVS